MNSHSCTKSNKNRFFFTDCGTIIIISFYFFSEHSLWMSDKFGRMEMDMRHSSLAHTQMIRCLGNTLFNINTNAFLLGHFSHSVSTRQYQKSKTMHSKKKGKNKNKSSQHWEHFYSHLALLFGGLTRIYRQCRYQSQVREKCLLLSWFMKNAEWINW